MRSIHQIVVGAGRGDAITSMALVLRNALRSLGTSEVYAHHLSPDVADEVFRLDHLPPGRRDDVLVYHASFGEPQVTKLLLSRPERIVIVYHNITPSEYFLEHRPAFAAGLQWGRHELLLLRDRVRLAVAVSNFNAEDLRSQGYTDVHVISAGLKPSRLGSVVPDGGLARGLRERFPNGYVLALSQVLPHKRFETLIQAMHMVQWVHEIPLGLVIVGADRMPAYWTALHQHANRLQVRDVWLTGGAPDRSLASFFGMASMFATASAHEGLALPPLEAMSFGVPVVARAAGAIADTIGAGGLVLPEDAGPVLFGEAIAEVHRNEELRASLQRAGFARVREIESSDPAAQFVELVRRSALA